MIYRCIAPDWLKKEKPHFPASVEGEYTDKQIKDYNAAGYNVYYFPNSPKVYIPGGFIDGSKIDNFDYVFADMDLKDGDYPTKDAFLEVISSFALTPSRIVDSGNGVHVYWRVLDLDAKSYLQFQRRISRKFITDENVSKICQLMRVPGTVNTKNLGNFVLCEEIYSSNDTYTAEEMDNHLSTLSQKDSDYCDTHYATTYMTESETLAKVDEKIPLKFAELIRTNKEVKSIWSGGLDDRSASDYRLGHIMFASGFTKNEAVSVLVNSAKALARAPIHRISYATNIVDKIWLYETDSKGSMPLNLSNTVEQILSSRGDTIKGTRFPCWSYVDDTKHGFRLGHVIGLVAGSGAGKTAIALNMFAGFVESNPNYDHFFVSLEQPAEEIADRWKSLCGDNIQNHSKVHVIGNYDPEGNFRDLSLETIRTYLLQFQKTSGRKIGCVVIDHIGVLANDNKLGQDEGVKKLCKAMKSFAVTTNTLLVMQSQTSREKAGIGDLELNKDAAFGTSVFENFCDYLITAWQPLKRCYVEAACPTVTAFKFCKIRHKKQGQDRLKEDVCYRLFFDPNTESLREMTQAEEKSFDFFNSQAANKRKSDRKTDIVQYTSAVWGIDGKTNINQDSSRSTSAAIVPTRQTIDVSGHRDNRHR